MAVRATMAVLIAQIRLMINDVLPAGSGQIFADQEIQDVMDQTRQEARYLSLSPSPTYSGGSLLFLNYYAPVTDWEDDLTLWQYRINAVIPATSENITGHWTFAATTIPPVYIVGKTYDVYRTAADLLERWAAKWALAYDFSSDSQSFHRSQAAIALQARAHTYRLRQRANVIALNRSDIAGSGQGGSKASLAPTALDYMGSGDGR